MLEVPINKPTIKSTKKISQRLQELNSMVTGHYQHIWDCCCDHGFLGLTLLERHAAQTIHFVDIEAGILNQLQDVLLKRYSLQGLCGEWQVHCADVSALPMAEVCNNPQEDKHLIIIAGVGGELSIDLMTAILKKFTQYNLEFILCPVHHNFKVRAYLRENQFGLIDENLIVENNRGYEILHVSQRAGHKISQVGCEMWDLSSASHVNYLHKVILHYQRLQKNPQQDVQHIIKHYQKLLPTQ